MYQIVDFKTKKLVDTSNLIFTGTPEAPWEVSMDLEQVASKIYQGTFKRIPPTLSKYLPFLPIKSFSNFISLQEGETPLQRSKAIGPELGIDLYFKIEGKNPTGSFKDRGSAVEISVAKELGAKGIAVASTGNMAASCSCYAAAAEIPCFVFVPEDVPASKLAQVISYGGRIVQVKGTYNDAASLANDVAKELGFYLAGDYAFRVEGAKTAAFEIVEQLGWFAPDAVIVPMGCGTNLAAYYKGFREYRELGLTSGMPEVCGVQASGACAIVNSFDQGIRVVEPLKKVQTVASAIAVKYPLDGIKALDAIYSSDGRAIAVTDNEMLEAQYQLAKREGIFTECSGGGAVAALVKFAARGLYKNKTVVCILCGDGLKDPAAVLKVAIKPPTIQPRLSDFLSLYESSFFEGKSVAFVDQDKVVFSAEPDIKELGKYLRESFSVSFSDNHLEKIRHTIGQFLQKGKPITFSDLQDIIQDCLESVERPRVVELAVKDFEVETGKDKKAQAWVLVDLKGQEFFGKAHGVGPVDALINALKEACGSKIDFALTGYKVDIRNRGVDAVVYVDLRLVRNGTTSLGRGASPDIIQASIHAFEEAYNGLF